ncbi:MAG: menaquinone biosynthesis family protein [Thermoplasmata archaeon]|nr:MqnA/MqnD/SBP family protein [Thermoplasmata archaeon]
MITICHTPDADDAFMFHAIVNKKIELPFEINFCVDDIETLNKMAMENKIDVTAASVYTYFMISEKYDILSAGGSFGEKYGPIIVSKKYYEEKDIKNLVIAVPGKLTSSYLIYKIFHQAKKEIEMNFQNIMDSVIKSDVDLGLLIHEGQDTYKKFGLNLVSNLYNNWSMITDNLPLPLGINIIRKDLDEKIKFEVLRLIKESVIYALNNKKEALQHAMKYSRGNDEQTILNFALKYVNDRTYDMGEDGKKAINFLLKLAQERKLINKDVKINII